ncbi:hypothetical protein KKI23_02810 [Patescibacteria group bacterium]|nr:hypothetical protein [Patescibacteria group bacterium]
MPKLRSLFIISFILVGILGTFQVAQAEVDYPKMKLQVPFGDVKTLIFPYLTEYLEGMFGYFVGLTPHLAQDDLSTILNIYESTN